MKNQIQNNSTRLKPKEQIASKLLTNHVPVVRETATLADIEKLLLQQTSEFETINYIYIVDGSKKLKGVVSIKEIFRLNKGNPVKDLLPSETVSVRASTDQERIALLALKHKLSAIPVVDKENHFLGVVPSDKIMKIIDNEAVENILRFGGITHVGSTDDIFRLSLFQSLKHRLPWLLLGLVGGILASGIIKSFEDVLSHNLILAAFIPLIVYMADAVGTQMEAFIIRDLAVNLKLEFKKYFLRQLSIILIIGLICSTLLYLGSLLIYDNSRTTFVLSLSLFLAILSSVVSGLTIPYLFSKFKLDPANASGPIATIIQDIVSVFLYFSIASLIL
jgi:magnesium transporter